MSMEENVSLLSIIGERKTCDIFVCKTCHDKDTSEQWQEFTKSELFSHLKKVHSFKENEVPMKARLHADGEDFFIWIYEFEFPNNYPEVYYITKQKRKGKFSEGI